mmetsp:Transcript_13514/g.40019  ORF Transcript_13514/g.40019 Transcript_13514/m.40019 type:complete len:202 (+) Transcript_13514:859-1464(+)
MKGVSNKYACAFARGIPLRASSGSQVSWKSLRRYSCSNTSSGCVGEILFIALTKASLATSPIARNCEPPSVSASIPPREPSPVAGAGTGSACDATRKSACTLGWIRPHHATASLMRTSTLQALAIAVHMANGVLGPTWNPLCLERGRPMMRCIRLAELPVSSRATQSGPPQKPRSAASRRSSQNSNVRPARAPRVTVRCAR